ncbi:MAG: type II toxin-antitoxin system VapC family toxin [Microbacterium sp.]|uniref:type II toxin-antitoxin system tRNA(fMet)-specific endonuclease VapC n=1 Tax=Microbacterium sp. TaxID=51671 RepID=UPI003BB09CC3
MTSGYLLDTNILIFLLRRLRPSILERMQQASGSIYVSTISVAELSYGASRSADPMRNRIAVEELLSRLNVADFDAAAAHHSGEIRAELAAAGRPIGGYDVLLAGQARAAGLTMVTNNVGEFERVPGLSVEDWSVEP